MVAAPDSMPTESDAGAALQQRTYRLLVSPQSALPLALFNALLAGLFSMMLWDVLSHAALLTWLSAAALLGVLDVVVRRALAAANGTKREWPILAVDAGVGLLWLFAAVAFFPAGHATLQFFYLFAIGAAALCTAVYQHYRLPGSYARIGLALPVAAAQVFVEAASFAAIKALIIVALWVCVVWLARRLHRALTQRVRLTINRDALLRKVEENARELDALRSTEARSRARAEDANLAKSRFLAHSSHDLRQPLHAISLLLESIDDERLDRQSLHVVGRVRQSVEMLAKLFDSLLDLTLLDTGQVSVRNEAFAVDDMLNEIVEDFAAIAEANGAALGVQGGGCYVEGDPTIVRRILQNLVANGIRHAPDGSVTLRAQVAGDAVTFDVEDTGSGIPTEDQERIFEEFTRLDTPGNGRASGSLGLGLSIVSRLARLTGVEVGLDSAPGRGSRFSIGPFPRVPDSRAPAMSGIDAPPAVDDVFVVVFDDDADTLQATGRLLSKWGFEVALHEKPDAEGNRAPDIIVCDYELGAQVDGIDVIHALRRRHGADLPALLISGNTTADLAARAAGEALPLLHKPVRPAQLKSAILTLLGKARR